MQSALLLDVVVGEGAAVLQLLAREDEALLVRGDALLVLNFGLDGIDSVGGFNLESDCFTGECFHKYLHCNDFGSCLNCIILMHGLVFNGSARRPNHVLLRAHLPALPYMHMPFRPSQPNASSLPASRRPPPAPLHLCLTLPHAADGLVDPQPQTATTAAANAGNRQAAKTMTHRCVRGCGGGQNQFLKREFW